MILKFSEVLEIKNGKNQKKVEKIGGKYPIYGSGGIIGWTDSYLCEGNNVIIGRKGNINKPLFVDKPFWNVDTAFGLISKEGILNSKYLYYFCLNYNFEKLNTTVTIPSLTKNNLLNIKINVPDLKKQEKIVKILDNIKEILLKKQNQISSLNFLSKCLFFEMFGNLIINDKNWLFEPLEKICDVRDGTHDSPEYVSEGFPLITSRNIVNNIIDFKNVNYISKIDFEKINKRSKVELGDILMPMIGTIGNPVIINSKREFAIKNVALIKFKNSKVSNIFIRNLLSSEYFESIVRIKNRGGTQKFLSLNDIRKISIPIVSLELQNKFAKRIKLIEKSKFALSKVLKIQLECTFLKQI